VGGVILPGLVFEEVSFHQLTALQVIDIFIISFVLLYCNASNMQTNFYQLRIEFHSGCIYWIMNAMVKLANP